MAMALARATALAPGAQSSSLLDCDGDSGNDLAPAARPGPGADLQRVHSDSCACKWLLPPPPSRTRDVQLHAAHGVGRPAIRSQSTTKPECSFDDEFLRPSSWTSWDHAHGPIFSYAYACSRRSTTAENAWPRSGPTGRACPIGPPYALSSPGPGARSACSCPSRARAATTARPASTATATVTATAISPASVSAQSEATWQWHGCGVSASTKGELGASAWSVSAFDVNAEAS